MTPTRFLEIVISLLDYRGHITINQRLSDVERGIIALRVKQI